MPLKKLPFKPGINRENTPYTAEGRWYDCDRVRFRQGTPEAIGGWQPLSANTYTGVATALWNWESLGGLNLLAVGTNYKLHVEYGGVFYDATPIRRTLTLGIGAFTSLGGSSVRVTDVKHGALDGDYVRISYPSLSGGVPHTANDTIQITLVDANTYTITVTDTPIISWNLMSATVAYQINSARRPLTLITGWGAGTWGAGTWGTTGPAEYPVRYWSLANYGENLVACYSGSPIYQWSPAGGLVGAGGITPAATAVTGTAVPTAANLVLVSDTRFVFAFGTTDELTGTFDPLLLRWSMQEDITTWNSSATTSAGSMRLARGAGIVAAQQGRQEILVWTDTSLYSLQSVSPPLNWGQTLVDGNISIASQNATAMVRGTAFWMGRDAFYRYDGRVQPMRCDVRQYVFQDFNAAKADRVFAGTNEAYNEVWWFYPSANSDTADKYVVYNHAEDLWYYGTMNRSAWLDSPLRPTPMAAVIDPTNGHYNTPTNIVVYHESGTDDNTGSATALNSFVTSSQFDMDDGEHFMFVWRVLPDFTFRGSSNPNPQLTVTLHPMKGSGSGYFTPASTNNTATQTVTGGTPLTVETYTNQINTRVRARQMTVTVACTQTGTTWQMGMLRMDMRPDGRR